MIRFRWTLHAITLVNDTAGLDKITWSVGDAGDKLNAKRVKVMPIVIK